MVQPSSPTQPPIESVVVNSFAIEFLRKKRQLAIDLAGGDDAYDTLTDEERDALFQQAELVLRRHQHS